MSNPAVYNVKLKKCTRCGHEGLDKEFINQNLYRAQCEKCSQIWYELDVAEIEHERQTANELKSVRFDDWISKLKTAHPVCPSCNSSNWIADDRLWYGGFAMIRCKNCGNSQGVDACYRGLEKLNELIKQKQEDES